VEAVVVARMREMGLVVVLEVEPGGGATIQAVLLRPARAFPEERPLVPFRTSRVVGVVQVLLELRLPRPVLAA
jgi:hypothetical protein